MNQMTIKTGARFEMIDITERIRSLLKDKGFTDGFCFIFVPHTTAAVTINENADPDVPHDIITIMDRLVPLAGHYRHLEGNSAAHVKASLIGASEWLMVENSRLVLGTWQSVFFCEFDGPRTRKIIVRLLPSKI